MTRELIAAYAAGGLTAEERERVEALLDENAGARAELDALRALIDETREARPRPEQEPAWDDMARAIRLAVDDVKPSLWQRWWVRPLAITGAAAAVAAALYLGLSSSSDAPRPTREAAVDAPALDIELPGLEESWDADSIVYELDPDEGFEDMFATADSDDTDSDEVIDFRMPPESYQLLDTIDEDDLEAVEAALEEEPS